MNPCLFKPVNYSRFSWKGKNVNSELRFEVPTWNQIYHMLLNLAERVRGDRFRADVIVGVSRGGWPPARVLSDLLSNPNLANVRAEFYVGVGETKGMPQLTQPVSMPVALKKVLVVDEVADTGKSLQLVRSHLIDEGATEVKIATIYYKPWSIVKPDYYEKETSCWIVFPWEIKETIRKIVRKSKEKRKPVGKEISKLVEAGLAADLIDKLLKESLEEEGC